jgi:hypothetical protein
VNTRFVINNWSRLSDLQCFSLIREVIEAGKISETRGVEHYCHVSIFWKGGRRIEVHTLLNYSGTITFKVIDTTVDN